VSEAVWLSVPEVPVKIAVPLAVVAEEAAARLTV
jgi:hypothetical protein